MTATPGKGQCEMRIIYALMCLPSVYLMLPQAPGLLDVPGLPGLLGLLGLLGFLGPISGHTEPISKGHCQTDAVHIFTSLPRVNPNRHITGWK